MQEEKEKREEHKKKALKSREGGTVPLRPTPGFFHRWLSGTGIPQLTQPLLVWSCVEGCAPGEDCHVTKLLMGLEFFEE